MANLLLWNAVVVVKVRTPKRLKADFVDLESTKMETINRVSYKVFAWSIRRGDIALNCRYQAISRFDPETGGGRVNERYGDFSPVIGHAEGGQIAAMLLR